MPARASLLEAVARLKKELAADGKDVYFTLFGELWNERSLESATQASSYAALARKYSVTQNDVGNYLRVVRQRLRAILREIVTVYLALGENVEDEIKFILSR
jgi:hypothetical protein